MTTPEGVDLARTRFSPTPVMRPVDQVRISIVQAIATGALRPGDRLPSEHEQARGFRVSRAAVREALRSLVDMGLVETARDPELSIEAWLALDVEFHHEVAASAENRVLMVPLSALHAIVQPGLNEAIRPLIDRPAINGEHTAIHDAI